VATKTESMRMKTNDSAKNANDNVWPTVRWVNKKKRWLVDGRLGRGGKDGGQRWWLLTRAEADEKRAALRTLHAKEGTDAFAISNDLRNEAQQCAARLKPFGKTLTEATTFLIAHLEQTAKSTTWPHLVETILKNKRQDGRSTVYISDISSRLGMFSVVAGDRKVSEIETREIDKWLRELRVSKPGHPRLGELLDTVSRNNVRRLMVGAFNTAVELGYCSTNPAKAIPIAVVPRPDDDEEGEDDHEVTLADILRPEELAALLVVADPELLPYIVLAAFCGIRRSGLRRIRWSRVDWEKKRIYVPGRVAKGGDGHWIELRAAYEFLLPYRERTGKVTPKNFRELLDDARAKAHKELVAAGTEHTLAVWPPNCLRHGFASYHYSRFDDAKLLATEMGHRDVNLIFTTYRVPAPKELAAAFWALTPTFLSGGSRSAMLTDIENLKIA